MFRTNCWYDTQCIKGSNSLNFLFTHALSLELAVIAGTSQQRAVLTITYACLCQLVEDELLLACISNICYCQTALSEYCINQNTNWEVILSFGDFFSEKKSGSLWNWCQHYSLYESFFTKFFNSIVFVVNGIFSFYK